MRTLLPALLLAVPLPLLAQPALLTAGITPPAQLRHGEKISALLPRKPITGGDTILTGPRGSAAIQLAGDSIVTLGGDSALLVHSMDAASPGRGPVLRLQLLSGDLQLEAYPPSGAAPHDYRINLGPLRLRALGADLWAYANGGGEGVCLHQGAVEITGDAGSQRLDIVGDCVRHDNGSSKLQLLEQAETQIRDSLLNPEPVDAPAPAASSPTASVAVAPAAGRITKPTAKEPRWIVVLATLTDEPGAARIARKLKQHGVRVEVMAVARPRGFRVVSGSYRSRKEAAHVAMQLRRQYRLKHLFVAEQP